MKKIASLLGIAAMIVCLPLLVDAGEWHTSGTLRCADCHVMHASQTHAYGGETPVALVDEPHEFLLRQEVNNLCLSCHGDGGSAIDVQGPANGLGGLVRQGGGLNLTGDGNEFNGHTLGATSVEAPGGDWTTDAAHGLACVDCHHQHGHNPAGDSWRNLRGDPGHQETLPADVIVTYAVGTNDLTKDVYETSIRNYDVSGVWFNEPDPTASAYAEWCKSCHTLFHGAKGGAELGGATGVEWLRHPTNDADIGAQTGGHSNQGKWAGFGPKTNWVKVMSETENWDGTDAGAGEVGDQTPSCMTCHKAHGNENPFGLIYMAANGTVTENGTAGATVQNLCGQCHLQGP